MSIYFHNYLPLEKGMAPSFEQTWFPITQGCFVPSLVEIGPVILKKIFKVRQYISLFPYYLPLEKGVALHLKKLESSSPKDALCQVWLKLAQWFLRRRWKCENFTDRRTDGWRRTNGQTDWLRTTGDQKSSLVLSARWAKNRWWQFHCETLGKRCECHGFSVMTIINGCPVSQYRCGTLKNPQWPWINAEHRSKFAALHRHLWRLHMSKEFSSWNKNTKQTNKQINKPIC